MRGSANSDLGCVQKSLGTAAPLSLTSLAYYYMHANHLFIYTYLNSSPFACPTSSVFYVNDFLLYHLLKWFLTWGSQSPWGSFAFFLRDRKSFQQKYLSLF